MAIETAVKAGRGVAADESLRPGIDDRITRDVVPARRRTDPANLRWIGPLVLLGVWFAASASGALSARIFPAPLAVGEAGWRLVASGALGEHLLVSLQRAMLGLVIGIVVGLALAIVTGLFALGQVLLDANLQMIRAMPILALLPLAIIWFGIGEEVKVFLVALAVAFPIYLNTYAGIRGVDRKYIDLARTVGLGKVEIIRRIVLPGALPNFFTGLRFAVSIAWLVLVVSEQINASSGIGYLMMQARSLSQTDIIVVGLVVYALLGLISDTLVRFIERKTLTWRSTL
ncbi:ABC transporter permease [Agromyces endophyticus]|uniref:ABC transporter permease n=1 Tax=Agromyces sp. H17E-10 TaxID=2932244 RepID=UPI001FD53F15|nr:ABC transporter permease [Agromyces sp. H17E-10]UOQ90184.1 ABC transporter permease [Agromyces sp. H17E-10]